MQYGDILIEHGDEYDTTIRFANFGVDDATPNARHERYAYNNIAPVLRFGGSVHLLGLTSRSGSDAHNRLLAQRRIDNVVALLRNAAGSKFQVASTIAAGERLAAVAGVADNTEDSRWRAVLMTYGRRQRPPPVPKASPNPRLMQKFYQQKSVMIPQKQPAMDDSHAEDISIIMENWDAVSNPEQRVSQQNPIELPLVGWELRTIIVHDIRPKNAFGAMRWIEFNYRWAEGQLGRVTVIKDMPSELAARQMMGNKAFTVVDAIEGADMYYRPWRYTPIGDSR